jgi:hypothetical protein
LPPTHRPRDALGEAGRDVTERQRTLHETLAWSHDLLPPAARSVFAALGVFAGGFTADAALVVCDEDDVVRTLATLIDSNLVNRRTFDYGSSRYWMYEIVRSFACERLRDAGQEEATRERLLGYFIALAASEAPAHVAEGYVGDVDAVVGIWRCRCSRKAVDERGSRKRWNAAGTATRLSLARRGRHGRRRRGTRRDRARSRRAAVVIAV